MQVLTCMPESKKKDKNHEKSEKTGVNEVNIPKKHPLHKVNNNLILNGEKNFDQ